MIARDHIGRRQADMLFLLDRPPVGDRGFWHIRAGWDQGGPTPTIRMLETLRKQGLVFRDAHLADRLMVPSTSTYRLTADGEALLGRLKATATPQAEAHAASF